MSASKSLVLFVESIFFFINRSMGSSIALIEWYPYRESAKGLPIIFSLLRGSRSGTQYFTDLCRRVPFLDLSENDQGRRIQLARGARGAIAPPDF